MHFLRWLPEPAAMVIDAGMFDGTPFAYLVTNWPGDEALEHWVQLNQDNLGGTEVNETPDTATVIFSAAPKSPATIPKAKLGHGPASGSAPAQEYIPAGVSPAASGALSGFFGQHQNAAPESAVDAVPKAPGDFTKQFFPLSSDDRREVGEPFVAKSTDLESNQRSSVSPVDEPLRRDKYSDQPPSPASSMKASDRANQSFPKVSGPLMDAVEAGQFTDLFFKRIEPQESVVLQDVEERHKGTAPGGDEFTSFFQGPFSGDRSAQTPEISVNASPQEKVPGDFTRVFGSSDKEGLPKPQPFQNYVSPNPAAPKGSSTEIFGPPKTPVAEDRVVPAWQPNQAPSAAPPDFVMPADPIPNAVPSPRLAAEAFRTPEPFEGAGHMRDAVPTNAFSNASGNATRVFSARDAGPSMEPAEPTGPSQWTIFQSGENAASAPREEPAVQPDSRRQALGSLNPAVASPAAPAIPSVQAPVIPSPITPQVPISMQPPAMPTPSVPVLSSQAAPAPKAPFSYWPLVIVLNVLFIIAVLLVLYFALKH